MIGQLIGSFIAILIAVSLYPLISEQVEIASADNELNPAMAKVLSLIPLLFALAIGMMAISTVVSSLNGYTEYSNSYDEDNEDVPEEEKPHKQTYLEYVQERRKVEELM